eukprot:EG_transcript_21879
MLRRLWAAPGARPWGGGRAYAVKAKKVRIGGLVMFDGAPHRVLEREFSQKSLNSTALVLVLQRLPTGKRFPQRFDPQAVLEEVPLTKVEAQFAMAEDDHLIFVPTLQSDGDDDSAADFVDVPPGVLPEAERKFLALGMAVTLHCFEDEKAGRQVVRIALPPSAVYTVDAVAAGVASVGLSARVRVPDFIKAGDSVLVSIVSGEYKEKQ